MWFTFWGSEVLKSRYQCLASQSSKTKVPYFWRSLRESISLSFSASRDCSHYLACGPLHLKSFSLNSASEVTSSMIFLPPSFPYKDSCHYIGPTWICTVPFPHKVTSLVGRRGKGYYSAYHIKVCFASFNKVF